MYFEDYAAPQCKGRRRELRSDVRNSLGTSSDPAPNIEQALLAANKLGAIIDLASNGRFGLAVIDLHDGWEHGAKPSKVIYTSTAISHVRHCKINGERLTNPATA